MALDRISLSNFRNHSESSLDGAARFNLLVGENGAGKTNVLEALSLLAPGRGLRRAPLAEMAREGEPAGFAIGATLHPRDGGEPVRLGTHVEAERPGRRLVRINGAQGSAVALGEWLAVGWLTPAMDGLFTGAKGERRRFVDRMALAVAPTHAHHATRYEAALRERNRLISDDRAPEPQWLDAIEAQMATHGSALAMGRERVVAALRDELARQDSAPFAHPLLALEPGGPAEEAKLAELLRAGRGRDRQAGRTLTGPHRADLIVTMAGKDAPAARCSTGEQKAMLIAITLAHGTLAARGRAGVLLLDEVAAHLDPLRRAALFERLAATGAQSWMTGTELAPFETIRGEAAVWRVAGGALERL
ncbi:DNA replication/repair protein RecF [Erythrobacter sp. LQ02-29]|uniref:DNA replication/repair protein RecF n=1 Tax=Erythrobacter sp. LQ02-29 TaxID=2920384 RepID=UPI001F4EDE26|nr:DNA replication/repair protein RecF [Erythrobacter sp. LQ02-29]MCP9222675.1 DNA replication/repair protein RecF [Erythrobacter sp. LQ02-29]